MRVLKELWDCLVRPKFYFDRKVAHDMFLVGIANVVEGFMFFRSRCLVDHSVVMWALFSPYMISEESDDYKRPSLRQFFRDMFTVGITSDTYRTHRGDTRWRVSGAIQAVARIITGIVMILSLGTLDLELNLTAMFIADEFITD